MKKTLGILTTVSLMACLFYFSSCAKEPVCKQCSAVQQVYQNSVLYATQNISAVKYCDSDLDAIQANPVVTTTQTVGTITQTSTTTYTCN